MKRQGLLSLSGIALLAMIVLMTLHEWDYSTAPPTPERPDVPTLILEQMDATRHKPDGTPDYHLSASSLAWYETSNRSEMLEPRVEMFGNTARWLVQANQGNMRESEKRIELQGAVRAQRDGPEPISLRTEKLIYHAGEERLEIPVAVQIAHPGGRTRAGKLDADLNKGVIEIKGGVETRYVPTAD